ncbi:MAG: ZPR1 zinc finger domain-containing protein [Thermoplasmata archaeon]
MTEGCDFGVFVDIPCPSCGKKKVSMHTTLLDIPYVGTCIQSTIICKDCGYKSSDVSPVENRGAVKIEFVIEKPEDLDARVVKSSKAKIIFKELGVEIVPGPESETYISNVEGILRRFEDVLENIRPSLSGKELAKYYDIKERIERIIAGTEKLTVVIEDPTGISAIIREGDKRL